MHASSRQDVAIFCLPACFRPVRETLRALCSLCWARRRHKPPARELSLRRLALGLRMSHPLRRPRRCRIGAGDPTASDPTLAVELSTNDMPSESRRNHDRYGMPPWQPIIRRPGTRVVRNARRFTVLDRYPRATVTADWFASHRVDPSLLGWTPLDPPERTAAQAHTHRHSPRALAEVSHSKPRTIIRSHPPLHTD